MFWVVNQTWVLLIGNAEAKNQSSSCCCWWEEMHTERESWACWHCDRFRWVPPLVQSVLTASDSSGHTTDTKHSARDRFKWRQADSRVRPGPKRWWHSHSALWSLSQSHLVPPPPATSIFLISARCSDQKDPHRVNRGKGYHKIMLLLFF